jgi:anti-anti-sigma regulatory factor
MFEKDHGGLPTSSAHLVPDDSCKLLVEYQSAQNKYALAGIIDGAAKTLLDELAHSAESRCVTFDFGNVRRINSMGVALLLRCFKKLKDEKQTEIHLVNLNPVNTMLFRITGLFLLATPDEATNGEPLH